MNITFIEKQGKITFKNCKIFRHELENDYITHIPSPFIKKGDKTINITFIKGDLEGVIKNDKEWVVYHNGNVGYKDINLDVVGCYGVANCIAIPLFKEYEYIKMCECDSCNGKEVYKGFINGIVL